MSCGVRLLKHRRSCAHLTPREPDGSLEKGQAAPPPGEYHPFHYDRCEGGTIMAGGRAFKSNVRERREAERRMKALEKRRKKEEKKRRDAEICGGKSGTGNAKAFLDK